MSEFTERKARQMAREFKMGISLLAVLFCVFVSVAYRHYSKSFVDPPSKYASRPASAGEKPGPVDAREAVPGPLSLTDAKAPPRFVPPSYEQASDPVTHPYPAPGPAVPQDEIRVARVDDRDRQSAGGGSFRIVDPEGSQVPSPTPVLLPPPRMQPAASADELPSDEPPSNLPPRGERPGSTAIDPASFEQGPTPRGSVQRTEFQGDDGPSEDFDLSLPDLRPSGLASPPEAIQIDGPTRAIAQSMPVEPIRADDSFWLIAQRSYGSGAYFRALYEHNRQRFPEPDELPVGAKLEIPSVEFLRQHYPKVCPQGDADPPQARRHSQTRAARTYTVVGGESLFDVARFQLGQASRYVEILQMNRDVLGDRVEDLPAGLRLQLP